MYIIVLDEDTDFTTYLTLSEAQEASEQVDSSHTIFRLVDVALDCGNPDICDDSTCQSYREHLLDIP